MTLRSREQDSTHRSKLSVKQLDQGQSQLLQAKYDANQKPTLLPQAQMMRDVEDKIPGNKSINHWRPSPSNQRLRGQREA
mmetsp:Transcript_47630/g.106920  ORF Transcript_47630/g.106920 Transcript_47630/m.106920 type:complete len:80 (-) Transcript_47630:70-309(-)